MLFRIAMCFFVAVIVTFLSSVASAALIEVTDPSSPGGANNVTRDPATNLEWLDWTASTSISFNSMVPMLLPGGTYEGWSYATRDQIRGLFDAAGLSTTSWPFATSINDSGLAYGAFVSFLGETYPGYDYDGCCGVHGVAATWAFSGDPMDATRVQATRAYMSLTSSTTHGIDVDAYFTDSKPTLGHALVRSSAIPEPSTLTLLGLGLTEMSFFGWRRKRKQAKPAS